nr:AAA domain-containing protein [Nakamurella deserti]
MTPFTPQARLLEALVGDGHGFGIGSTVHRFQGGERGVVVFDTVDAPRGVDKPHPWFHESSDSADGPRLINVAVSRARERLVLVKDRAHLVGKTARTDPLGRFFRAAVRDADFVNPLELLQRAGFRQPDLHQLLSDIDAAVSTVQVWSESVTGPATSQVVGRLADAARRGCRVSLWFTPPGNGDLPDPLRPLINSEVRLRPCVPVREAVAIVDDVVWTS